MNSCSGSALEMAATAPEGYPAECECRALLVDGTPVDIRPIRPDDDRRLETFHEHLSAETIYKRFFSAHPHLRAQEVERFTRVDYRSRLALVAERAGRLLGVARYDASQMGGSAEVAFVVADEYQGLGLGTLLLEHLISAGRHRGITEFVADTLLTNHQMQAVFRHVGFGPRRETQWSDGVVHVNFPIAPTQEYLDAVMARHFTSAVPWVEERTTKMGPASPGLQSVCLSPESAALVAQTPRVTGIAVVNDPSLGLAGLAGGGKDGVVVELGELRRAGRFIAVVRAADPELRVAAFDPERRFTDVCRQAGLPSATTWAGAFEAACHRRSGKRGCLPDLQGCDVGSARWLLDQATSGPGPVTPFVELDTCTVRHLLESYQLVQPTVDITIGDDSGGVAATTVDCNRRATRAFLPLTDVDAAVLAGDQAESVLRMARLVGDQPDIRRLEVSRTGLSRMWIGPRRGSEDDPLVRRMIRSPEPFGSAARNASVKNECRTRRSP